jgi:hypothetical protein
VVVYCELSKEILTIAVTHCMRKLDVRVVSRVICLLCALQENIDNMSLIVYESQMWRLLLDTK